MKQEDLDKRICDMVPGADNTESYRQFIRSTEEEYGFDPINVDKLSEAELERYLSFLDDLWSK